MAIDTLAYVKALEAAGLEREAAEAQVGALAKHVLPDLVTASNLDAAVDRIDTRLDQFDRRLDEIVERLEHRIDMTVERTAHQQTVRHFGLTLGIVGLMNAILFGLLRVVH
jgi:hypothetical protein